MTKAEFEWGHASIDEFFWWINERHEIYMKKTSGEPKPWTDDKIMQRYKFCNVFRELDTGTIALRKMCGGLRQCRELELLAFNICWYRVFNRYEHAQDIGWCPDYEPLRVGILAKHDAGEKIVTSAHMTYGEKGRSKTDTLLDMCADIWARRSDIADECVQTNSMESVFTLMRKFQGVGAFLAYEMVTDFSMVHLLANATDRLTWANIGPGSKRGLQRLGRVMFVPSLIELWKNAEHMLEAHVSVHHPLTYGKDGYADERDESPCKPLFELREIEHSLCEFDKYQRALSGAGRPRMRYDGTA